MFGISTSIAKYIGIALVVIFLGFLSYFAIHTFTSTVKQNGQLQATNVTLHADAAKASSATEVAVKKLDQLDNIIQQKAKDEQAIHKDNRAFTTQRQALEKQDSGLAAWSSVPVPPAVISSLCQRTAVRSPDCHRDQDTANPQSSDSSDSGSDVQAGN
jgi:deoxyribodipyrimidine photolyase